MRIATYNTELSRKGPGLLLRDILRGDDPSVTATIDVLVSVAPDIVVLQGIDFDLNNTALNAFAQALASAGLSYPHRFALPGNAGRQTPLDLDGDGRLGGPGDAQGYGEFFGIGGMAILSRFPIIESDVQDYTDLLWRALPGALLPQTDQGPFPSGEALAIQRLSSHSHWVVPVDAGKWGRVTLLTFHASPPVFDGPEDRNGRRNHDEITFWQSYLAGTFGPVPDTRFILLGDANLDPVQGDGIKSAITGLLSHPDLQDPLPGEPTVTWEGVGNLRVDYVLPSSDWIVTDAGIQPTEPGIASRHDLVWVDLER